MVNNATELFIHLFRKYRLWLVLLYVILVGVSVALLKPKFLRYKGQNTFYMAPDLVYSEKMMNKMIITYDLYDHYGIDTLQPYFHQRTVNILTSRTEIYRVSSEIIRLTVYDRNNEIAAAIANSMVGQLNELYRNYLRREYLNDIELYKSLMIQSKLSADLQRQKLDSVLNEFKAIVSDRSSAESKELLDNIEHEIRSASSALTSITENQVSTLEVYTETMRLSRPSNINSIVTIKKALPDMRSHKYLLAIYSMIASLVGVMIIFSFIYMLHYYKKQLARMFS